MTANVIPDNSINNENTERINTQSEIAEALASAYEIIYAVDIDSDHYIKYTEKQNRPSVMNDITDEGDNFSKIIGVITEKVVHPDDRGYFRRVTEKNYMLEKLSEKGSFSFTYRHLTGVKETYYNLFVFLPGNNPRHIIVAIRNVDEQIRSEKAAAEENEVYNRVASALASRYEVIFDIDTDTNNYIQYSASEGYARLGTAARGSDFFSAARKDINSFIHEDDRRMLAEELNKMTLLENLLTSGSVSLRYRQFINGRYQYMSMRAVLPKNDSHHIVIGVYNIDDQVRRMRSLHEESETFNKIINALSRKYEIIYYINLETNEYKSFNSSPDYDNLNTSKFGDDFFSDTKQSIKHEIYYEDYRDVAEAMDKDNFIERLGDEGMFTLNYRLMLDNRPQYMALFAVRMKEDPRFVVIAVANIDSSIRKEIAINEALGNAIDVANRDPLTGVKSHYAYDKTVAEIDSEFSDDSCPEFAVAVCDINGLKTVNDTLGHSAGDEYIRSACRLICNIFKHSPVFRIGGDEFAVILRGQDYHILETLKEEFGEKNTENLDKGRVTVSLGTASALPGRDRSFKDVFIRADTAMYSVKKWFKEQNAEKLMRR